MKKIIVLIAVLSAAIMFSSYVLRNHSSHNRDCNGSDDWIYWTTVEAVEEDGSTCFPIKIYYEEVKGGRKYYSECKGGGNTCYLFVGNNDLYGSSSCRDFRRNYKYRTFWSAYYFNCSKGFPRMINPR